MVDEPGQPGFSEHAVDSLTDARRAVNSATEEVAEVGRHFKKAVESAKQPGTYLAMLEDLTRAAPLAMLGIAFIAGATFASRRQRRY